MNETGELVSEYIDALYAPLSERLGALRSRAEKEGVPIILKDTEMFLRSVFKIKRPERVLEIGTAVGYSAACFAGISKDIKIVTIDVDERMYKKASSNLEEMGLLGRVRVLLGDGAAVINESLSEERFDLVFIDAAKSHYRSFFNAAVRVINPGAVIISDNIILKGTAVTKDYGYHNRNKTSITKMRDYIDYITSLKNAETAVLRIGDGVAMTVFSDYVEV